MWMNVLTSDFFQKRRIWPKVIFFIFFSRSKCQNIFFRSFAPQKMVAFYLWQALTRPTLLSLSLFYDQNKINFLTYLYLVGIWRFLHSFTFFLFQSSDQVNYFPVLSTWPEMLNRKGSANYDPPKGKKY